MHTEAVFEYIPELRTERIFAGRLRRRTTVIVSGYEVPAEAVSVS